MTGFESTPKEEPSITLLLTTESVMLIVVTPYIVPTPDETTFLNILVPFSMFRVKLPKTSPL